MRGVDCTLIGLAMNKMFGGSHTLYPMLRKHFLLASEPVYRADGNSVLLAWGHFGVLDHFVVVAACVIPRVVVSSYYSQFIS